MSDEIVRALDCPFCGTDEPEYVASAGPSFALPYHRYECRQCGARGPRIDAPHFPGDPQIKALHAWNYRHSETETISNRPLLYTTTS
jgi:hypothetical protein